MTAEDTAKHTRTSEQHSLPNQVRGDGNLISKDRHRSSEIHLSEDVNTWERNEFPRPSSVLQTLPYVRPLMKRQP